MYDDSAEVAILTIHDHPLVYFLYFEKRENRIQQILPRNQRLPDSNLVDPPQVSARVLLDEVHRICNKGQLVLHP